MPPRKVFFELTRACNLACVHCLNDSGEQLPDELQPDQVLALVQDLGHFGVREIRFTGGEPTISPVLVAAIRLAHELGMRTSIGTNAVAIVDAKAKELGAAGLDAAIVSIDGDQEAHDRIRGKDSYRRSWRGIHALTDACIKVRVNAVAMRTTLAGMPALAAVCKESGVALHIRRFIPSGRMTGQMHELLSVQEYEAMWQALAGYVTDGIVDGHYRTDSPGHCSAGVSGMVILPDGQVQSCGFLSDLGEPSYGNVARDGIATVWSRMHGSAYLSEAAAVLQRLNTERPDLPRTNCLAIAMGGEKPLIQLRRKP